MPEPADDHAVDPRALAALEELRARPEDKASRAELGGMVDHGGLPPALERLHALAADRWPVLADRPGWFVVGLVALVAVVLGGGLRWVTAGGGAAAGPTSTLAFVTTTTASGVGPPTSGAAGSAAPSAAGVVVHAAGAVQQPGVHRVAPGSRVADVLAAAGGPAPDADLDRLNLAAPVGDGQRLFVPRIGDPGSPPVPGLDAGPTGAAPDGTGGTGVEGGGSGDGGGAALVDLNGATASELEALPGIGPATSAAILEHRETNGPFRAVEELLDVRGIGPAKLEGLRDLVTVG